MAKLFISKLSARGLDAADSNGLSDPYLKIFYAKNAPLQTSVISKELNPSWPEQFTITAGVSRLLNIEVWDHNKIQADTKLGEVTIDISKAMESPGTPLRKSVAFSNRGRSAGDLTIELIYSGPSAVPVPAPSDAAAAATPATAVPPARQRTLPEPSEGTVFQIILKM